MARNTNNSILHKAKESKSDEFYTQYCDIERELINYSDQFKGKTVYCNCDDPAKSNFFKYFVNNFHKLGLKQLIASSYSKPKSSVFTEECKEPGHLAIYNGEHYNDIEELCISKQLHGDGDFRSMECRKLLDECDVVVTNPPFSLFREFVAQVMKYGKEFLIIGNINAITYKEIFELIQDNKVWLGHNLGRGISGFIVPDHYELYGTEARIDESGRRIVSSNNCLWLTNLNSPLRNEFIQLSKKYYGNEKDYPLYDNYDAINVNRTQDIPMDFGGVMGVPITFLHKYNPNQFEIIKFRKGDDGKDLAIGGKCPYFRILIKNKQQLKGNTQKQEFVHKLTAKREKTPKSVPTRIDAIQLSLF